MKLYLLRHARPKPEAEDSQKPLAPEGLAQIKKITKIIELFSPIVADSVYHSPKTRARQTAELVAKKIKVKNGLVETDGLTPHDDPAVWAGRIKKHNEDIVLAGHLPHLGRLAALLLTGNSEREIINFHPATMACLIRTGKTWSLEWVINPNI